VTERNFVYYAETVNMEDFYNRIISKFTYEPTESVWNDELTVNTSTGDYLVGTLINELRDEYVLFGYTDGMVTPVTSKIRYVDHPIQTVDATIIDLYTYEHLGLGMFEILTASHYNQIGAAGKYFIIEEAKDYINNVVSVKMLRLWGV